MAPLPPAMLDLADAVKLVAVALEMSQPSAFDRLLDGLCDGAIYANGLFRAASGPPNCITVSPANWQMHKYNGAALHYDFVEIATVDLIKWLRLDKPLAATLADAAPAARSGAPGRPTSMFLVIEEAKRRIVAGEVDAPDKKAFAKELESWLSGQPGQPRATSKTIAGKFRHHESISTT